MRQPAGSESISPDALDNYLESTGWRRSGAMRDGTTQWEFDDRRVLVPRHPEFDDYIWLLHRVLAELAELEDAPVDTLALQVANPSSDLIQVSIEDLRPRGQTPLSAAIATLTAVRGIVEAAARNLALDLGMTSRRAGELAAAYGEAIDVAAARVGSYVIPILIPLQPPTLLLVPKDSQSGAPIGRRVTSAFAETLQQLEELATARRTTLGQEWILDRPALSALQAAVGTVHERELEFSFRWSRVVPQPPRATAAIRFDTATVEVLASRMPVLREDLNALDRMTITADAALGEEREQLEYPLTFEGSVELLRRGRPTLRGKLHGRIRAVWVHLDPEEYEQAIEAHRQRARVRVVGTIRERGRATPQFIEVESFEVLL